MNTEPSNPDDEPSSSSTPPRGRGSSRHLAPPNGEPGRVPLHRRGTSRTYETLEDLLKEAGYKETRIYTPETDRTGRDENGRRSGVGAVVDFISGFIPGTNSQHSDLSTMAEAPTRNRTPSPSPLPRRAANRPDSSYGRSLRPRSSATESLRAYAQRFAIQGPLRPMSSVPNMAKRTSGSHGLGRRTASSRNQPPLPHNWLDNVTQAVVGSSSTGAHIGGPAARLSLSRTTPNSPAPRAKGLPALAERTNRVQPLTVYIRPNTATSAVNTCSVVCRSAPASRSSSRSGDRLALITDKGKRRETRGTKGKKSPKSSDSVPTLASTRLENDVWGTEWVDGRRVPSVLPDGCDCDSSDDEDDGELDLARILVDPERQNSIHSLRRHLHRSESARALRERSHSHKDPWVLDDDEDPAPRREGRPRNIRTTSIEDGRGFTWADVPGFEQAPPQSRRRRGIPGTWSGRNTRS